MEHRISHDLSLPDARKLVRETLAAYVTRFATYAPQVSWQGDDHVEVAFAAKGLKLSGTIDIQAHEWLLQLDVPLLLRPLRALAVTRIDAEAQRLIASFKASNSRG